MSYLPKNIKKLKLCVFSGDTLKSLFLKGEIKERYYNPENFFDEVHFITFTDSEIDPKKVRGIVGNAKIFIHPVGKLTPFSLLLDRQKVLETVKEISPDIIRSYSPFVHGYFAGYCAKKLNIPFLLSLHINPENDLRYLSWVRGDYLNWVKFEFMKYFCESYAVSSADKIICVYKFAVPYAESLGGKNTTVLYNKVYGKKFRNVKPVLKLNSPGIISVGRLIEEKNPETLIRALKILLDDGYEANLVLIGNGPLREKLVQLANELGISEKVLFFTSIPNKDLPGYYKSCKLFAQSIKYGGVSIPVIEAIASGLPVIVSKPPLDPTPEISSEVGIVIENSPENFATVFNKILKDKLLYRKLRNKGLKKFKEIEGSKAEKEEAKIYSNLLSI